MAFNPRPDPAVVLTQHDILELQGKEEADKSPPLKIPPPISRILPEKIEYYIEMWKLGSKVKFTSVFETMDLKHVMNLIYKTKKYNVTYLIRLSDNKVIWDQV